MKKVYHVAVEATLDVIGGKWKPIILCHLGNRAMRTGELKKQIPNITQKMLVQQLRELEADKIINRTVYNQVPPKVEYSLTSEGKSLREILITMSIWGEKRVNQLKADGNDVEILSSNYSGFLNY
ncbi:MarR family transcriptional regulator [Carnobacterium maltaromaticum]|uniref:winged helix-turn-helix transcriptional regulator n=1 Tax=Carnobacterium maltaromaticum TaxID=2751 RepID=UPI000C77513D|nr:helix-turn-helix domain-containing protein [Carnobacterium maltaromaticum]PLS39180.1 MarR family transcriptional regulator [Carnobacterium maltaromaticum]PLS39990.1 MarR family transcriptional regulator [Carnobacterium maltaromaticum]PLS40327.1 MarR family transcriptional regulator [Carnobacterium maltaromaticum]PLS45969.1 MarR family transcriptional regulator [Carnobacterium maltaromaticum]PLS47121.1 MarR family transcriptional regulator [Carnobacterium maltaromaticum]